MFGVSRKYVAFTTRLRSARNGLLASALGILASRALVVLPLPVILAIGSRRPGAIIGSAGLLAAGLAFLIWPGGMSRVAVLLVVWAAALQIGAAGLAGLLYRRRLLALDAENRSLRQSLAEASFVSERQVLDRIHRDPRSRRWPSRAA
jgi:hypothetical protein